MAFKSATDRARAWRGAVPSVFRTPIIRSLTVSSDVGLGRPASLWPAAIADRWRVIVLALRPETARAAMYSRTVSGLAGRDSRLCSAHHASNWRRSEP